MRLLCPSILSADFLNLGEEIKIIEESGADIIHCDIMDGHFVPNISFGPDVVSAVNKISKLPLDVHLMIEKPELYIDKFIDAGADMISVHFENNYHLNRIISQIKLRNCKTGIVLNPATPVSLLDDVLGIADYILLMSVNPGFGGQKFIPAVLNKIRQLRKVIDDRKLNVKIQIDGGINLDNIGVVCDAGADMIVAGASIFKAGDKKSVIQQMKEIISKK
ncbi:ribulose-phosphate 3-epimerase [Ignavibacteria bacterium CHB1]|nr:MAG: ribulose-phosphate 3-epimerase [Chlorobiota bacterium]MBV6398274.1 Ribulose-phosphate 3-epimerase [Ignavibacteria bacterium]MCC6886133.1 ribulose-phosphate 3-epimerase [Ignavibacteriales bacterium]MCE7952615.1 ribulose-phosphate 3-epimerase [Chlorobi bacterium CHB7]MDL1886727.1 ribulose-phosphate 3-epimerase [Ignavibacteria bacterium CHB1]RIK50253.1 MAG: ribulose-phosphate 3-epimerase [Ignavibacteriota bacterium]